MGSAALTGLKVGEHCSITGNKTSKNGSAFKWHLAALNKCYEIIWDRDEGTSQTSDIQYYESLHNI